MKYDPFDHAEQMGVEVIFRKIRTANAIWYPDHRLIVVREGMKAVYTKSALAHEMGHVTFGHRDDRPKHEVQADRFACNMLIDPDEIVELMKWTPDSVRLAVELGVTTRLLRVYLNVHRLAG